jgi:hypothetical protein
MVLRIPHNRYPVPQGTIDISTLKNPALTTAGGKYTPNLSAAVSERVSLIMLKLYYRKNFQKEST